MARNKYPEETVEKILEVSQWLFMDIVDMGDMNGFIKILLFFSLLCACGNIYVPIVFVQRKTK